MMSQTFRNITMAMSEPNQMPTDRSLNADRKYSSTKPVRKVIMAAQRNHHRAFGTSLVNASTRPSSEAAAM